MDIKGDSPVTDRFCVSLYRRILENSNSEKGQQWPQGWEVGTEAVFV